MPDHPSTLATGPQAGSARATDVDDIRVVRGRQPLQRPEPTPESLPAPGRAARQTVFGLRRITVAVFVFSLVATLASGGVTRHVINDAERHQLQTRVREASLVLGSLMDNFSVPMRTAAVLMRTTGPSPQVFTALANPSVGPDQAAVAAALLRTSGNGASPARPTVVAHVGAPLALTAGGTHALGTVNGDLTIVDLLSSHVGRRLGLVLGAPEMPAGYAVYAEVQIPLPGVTLRNEAAFSDLDYAVYAGKVQAPRARILGTVTGPLTHNVASALTPVGNSDFLIVASPRSHLTGSLAGWLPWLMLVVGTIGGLAGAVLIETVSRRRDSAIGLSSRLERVVGERTSELQAANRELESFSYAVSHDLRAPLRAIDGFSLAIVEEYSDQLDDQGLDYLRRVRSGTQRMGELIDDLLTLSRVTRSEMTRERVDLSAVTRSIVARLREADPDRDVDVVVAEGVVARGDERLLRIALENLLANAWKFTSTRDDARVEFGATEEAGNHVYFVRDNGVGFNPRFADRLFTPFQRLHAFDEFEGSGIGLATVARVIRRHGGDVWARSVPGEGATFFFTCERAARPFPEAST